MQTPLKSLLFSFLFLVVFLSAFSREFPIRTLSVRKLINPPTIDGTEGKNEWKAASDISEFVITNGELGQLAQFRTRGKIGFDSNFLYILLHCEEPQVDSLKIKAKLHDDPIIFFDDRIEVFLDNTHRHRNYFDFIVNPAGVQAEQSVFQWLPGTRTYQTDLSWNSFWKVKTKIGKERWTVEIAIELKSLGVDTNLDIQTLGFNIGRVRRPAINPGDPLINFAARKGEEYSAFNFVQDAIWETPSNFYESWQFADIVLGEAGIAVKRIAFNNISYNGTPGKPAVFGNNSLKLLVDNLDRKVKILRVKVYHPAQEGIFDENFSNRTSSWEKEDTMEGNDFDGSFFLSQVQENLLEISILEVNSRKLLYKTSYVLTAAPMVTYDFESILSGKQTNESPVRFRLDTDEETRKLSYLVIKLEDSLGKIIDSFRINDLKRTSTFSPLLIPSLYREMNAGNYTLESILYKKTDNIFIGSFKQQFTGFNAYKKTEFGAQEEMYRYGGKMGHAVVVNFPNSAQFVFWRKASYIPFWELDQATMSNEFVESWDNGMEGCAEPIQDRECRFSSVSILENSSARVRIQWRYALNDAHYRIHANEWVDEIYTFYPDGSGVREVNLWANTQKDHEVFEAIFINPPGVTTYQLFEPEIISLKNLKGEQYSIRDFDKKAELYKSFVRSNPVLILETHFRKRLHPFTVFAIQKNILPMVDLEKISVARSLAPVNTRRGHWPASDYPVDGYNTPGDNVPGHFSLGNIHMNTNPLISPNRWIFLIGVKEKKKNFDVDIAMSWLNPVTFTTSSNLHVEGFDHSQKSYIFKLLGKSQKLSLQIKKSGILNPVLNIKDVTTPVTSIKLNGKVLSSKVYRWSLQAQQLILFLYKKLERNDKLEIELMVQ